METPPLKAAFPPKVVVEKAEARPRDDVLAVVVLLDEAHHNNQERKFTTQGSLEDHPGATDFRQWRQKGGARLAPSDEVGLAAVSSLLLGTSPPPEHHP